MASLRLFLSSLRLILSTSIILTLWEDSSGCYHPLQELLHISLLAVLEDLPHILSECPALESARYRLGHYTQQISELLPPIATAVLLDYCRPSHPSFCNFLLDCSVIPPVIRLVQDLGFDLLCTFFTVTRTWLFVLHRERLKLLGSWKLKAYWVDLYAKTTIKFITIDTLNEVRL